MSRLIKAICSGFAFCVCVFAQSSHTTTARLAVEVRTEAVLAWQGATTVVVTIRLAPGALVTVWQEDSCGIPSSNGQIISASGRYAIPLASLRGSVKGNICLASRDGALRTSLRTSGKGIGLDTAAKISPDEGAGF